MSQNPLQSTNTTGSPAALSRTKVHALGGAAKRGMAWVMAQTLLSKSAGLVGQFLLGYLLLEEDWGIFQICFGVAAFASIMQQAGLREVVVYRSKRGTTWENTAFWLSIVAAIGQAGLLMLLSPVIAGVYNEPRIVGPLQILAINSGIMAIGIVPIAKAQAELRFRLLALVDLTVGIGMPLLSVIFAWFGLGLYAFVLPLVIMHFIQVALLFLAVRPKIKLKTQWRKWKYLLSDASGLYIGRTAETASRNADTLLLGLFHAQSTVGIYAFAFRLSFQTEALFARGMMNVLMPVLNQLRDDPKRQVHAYLRAERALALVGVPFGFMLAASSESLINLTYPSGKWDMSIPVLQVLSIGMTMRLLMNASISLMLAQGRFRAVTVIRVWYMSFVIGCVFFAAWHGGALAVGIAVAVSMLIFGPIQIYVACKPAGEGFKEAMRTFVTVFLATATSFGLTYFFSQQIVGNTTLSNAARLAITVLGGLTVYIFILQQIYPKDMNRMMHWVKAKLVKRYHSVDSQSVTEEID